MLSPRSISPAATLMAFSMTTLPTVCETICSTSRIGTPLRISEASVRVKARQADLMRDRAEDGQLDAVRVPELPARLGF